MIQQTIKPCLITFETQQSHPGLQRLQHSAAKWGWNLITIQFPNWRGFGHKFKCIAEMCETAKQNFSHAVSVDARDFIVIGPVSEFEPPQHKLQFATEVACWPAVDLSIEYKNDPGTPWRYAHSPFTIDLQHTDLLHPELVQDHSDDQLHAHKLFLGGVPGVGLDYECKIVQSIAFCHPWTDFFEYEGYRLRNKLTGTKPLLLHGNGGTNLDWVQL